MRAGLRQPGPADHGRRQFGAVPDQGGGRLGRRAQAQTAVQPDASAQDQAARGRKPCQIQRRRRRGHPPDTVARAQITGQGVAGVGHTAAIAGFRAPAQRATAQLLAAGGDGREEQEQLGAEPSWHARVGCAQAGQPDERQA